MKHRYLAIKTVLTILLTPLSHYVFAVNQPKIDSLNKAFLICKIDTQKINILMDVAILYATNKEIPDSSIEIGKRVIYLSQKINYSLGISRGNRIIGLGLEAKNEFKEALSYLKIALKLDQQLSLNERVVQDYINLAECYEGLKEFDKSFENYYAAEKWCKKSKNAKGFADVNKEIGISFFKQKKYIKALRYFNEALVHYKKLRDEANVMHVYSILGNMYRVQNNYSKALEYQLKALQIAEQSNQTSMLISSYYLIADIYGDIDNFEKAIIYKQKALKLLEKNGDNKNIAACYFYIAKNYSEINQFDKSIAYCNKALVIFKSLGSNEGIGACEAILALAYTGLENYDTAFQHINKGIEIFEELAKTDKRFMISMSGNYAILGNLYLHKKEFNKAVKFLDKSIKLDKEQHTYRHDLIKKYESISLAYEGIGNFKDSYTNLKISKSLHDSIFSTKNNQQLIELQRGFDLEKKEIEMLNKAKIEENKIRLKASMELQRKQLQRNSLLGGFTLMMILAGISYRNYRRKINDNVIISEQKTILETKNKEITDSIEYALRIQTAILPPQKLVKQHLENSFILYKPKDIVAGDFYWMETVQLDNVPTEKFENEKQFENLKMKKDDSNFQIAKSSNSQIVLFAACDCTGHGVPGAMVSVVCHNALNRAVHEFGLTVPAAILDKTAEIVVENFAKSEEDIKDGMDISLCALHFNKVQNFVKVELQWAGANNPLWLIRNGEILETKADKQPIGMDEDHHPFTNHSFTLEKGDTIYVFSDGFADQFSPADKKLMKKNFKNVLLSIQDKNMQEQHEHLNNYIENWKGTMEQTDDILVIGVRV
jgi:tetratricopeptide (TPR) repeat protein